MDASAKQNIEIDERSRSNVYRPDIDVLRAIAVLSVLCFHWGISPFSGGFVGVDVFFVISGFLITRLVLNEIHSGQFSFFRFYERRARRILPALYLVIAFTCLAGWFFLLPTSALDLARSIISVILFSSNIFFWLEAGYFDTPAAAKPFLHTWSLSVEEQFYLVFPTLFFLAVRRSKAPNVIKHIVVGLLAICFASFAYNVWQVSAAPSSAFYLSPGRAWEFLLGSLLATRCILSTNNRRIQFFVMGLGLVMLFGAVLGFRPNTRFPGFAALLPCLGTGLCIWANTNRNPGRTETAMIILPVFFGKISYSLYLWHWPVWVFAKIWLSETVVTNSTKLILFGLTTLFSYLSYRFVEQPFRDRSVVGRRALLTWVSMASVAILSFGITGTVLDGFPSRLPPEIAALENYAAYPRSIPYRENVCFLQPSQKIDEYDVHQCATSQPQLRNILLVGDSLAAHYLPGLMHVTLGHPINIMQANSASCAPFVELSQSNLPNCDAMNAMVLKLLQTNPPDVVVYSANWQFYAQLWGYDHFIQLFRQTISNVGQGTQIVLLGPSIQYDQALPTLLASMALRGADISRPGKFAIPEIFVLDRRMEADFSSLPNVTYISVLQANCPNETCPVMIGSVPIQWDIVHLTARGSEQIVAAVMPQLSKVLLGE
jgi:peptidoglycan/LPS O-acetylase OafA/YrhL